MSNLTNLSNRAAMSAHIRQNADLIAITLFELADHGSSFDATEYCCDLIESTIEEWEFAIADGNMSIEDALLRITQTRFHCQIIRLACGLEPDNILHRQEEDECRLRTGKLLSYDEIQALGKEVCHG